MSIRLHVVGDEFQERLCGRIAEIIQESKKAYAALEALEIKVA